MDALSDVLRVAHLTGGVFLHAEFFAPWCIAARVAPEHCAPAARAGVPPDPLSLRRRGRASAARRGRGGDGVVLGPGEVVLLPRNDLHLMGSDLGLPPVMGSDIIQPPKDGGLFSIRHGGDGARTRMVCGFLGCDSAESNPVLATLAAAAQAQPRAGRSGGMDPLDLPVRRRGGRRRPPGIGDRAGQAVRVAVRRGRAALCRRPCRRARPDGSPVCATPMSRGRWRCCIATSPGAWTVDELGREVGLSRSALADRFIRLIGVPPMHYLAQLAHAGRDAKAAQHQRVPRPGRRDGRLRVRGRLFPRVQEGVRYGAGHVAALQQLARVTLGLKHNSCRALGALPSPLRGGDGGGGRAIDARTLPNASRPSPTLPHKGEGAHRVCGSH